MTAQLRYAVFSCSVGWVGVLASARGLLRATFPQRSEREATAQLGEEVAEAACSLRWFASLTMRLKAYYAGERISFPDKLDLSAGTPFQVRVWETTRLIPYGETKSYLWIAERLGQPAAARAVGQALAKNPLPVIIPCHRVLASDGKLGGFSGGLEMKQKLLRLEKGL